MATTTMTPVKTARLCKNIHQEWTLGWYIGMNYQQLKGTRDELLAKAVELGVTHLFVDFNQSATPMAEVQ
jgi:hypothetical protein